MSTAPKSPPALVSHGRQAYPAEAVDRLLSYLKIADAPHARVVEVAAGTGAFTEILAARPEAYQIVAVEPQRGMRERLAVRRLRGTTVLEGGAANVPLEDEWGDVCVIAGGFHWFAEPETLKELRRVLKPNGVLGMIWNVEDYNKPRSWRATTAWEQKLNDWIWSLPTDGHSRFRDERWQNVFQQQLTSNLIQILRDSFTDSLPRFSLPLGEDWVSWTVWLSDDKLWSRMNTLTQVAALHGEQRKEAMKMFYETLQGDDVERNEEGEIAMHGVTYFAWTDKI